MVASAVSRIAAWGAGDGDEVSATGITAGRAGLAAAGSGALSSSRIVLRVLRTAYSEGRASETRTRASDFPSRAVACSSDTPAIGPRRSTRLAALATETLRSSTSSVSESGRFTT